MQDKPFYNCIAVKAPAPFKMDLWHAPLNGPFHGYQYTLYWAESAGGPFTAILPPMKAGERHADHTVFQSNYKMGGNEFVLVDLQGGPGDTAIPHKPLFYQVGEEPVVWDTKDVVTEHGEETRSNVIGPGTKAVIRIESVADDVAEIKTTGWRGINVAMALEEQRHHFWNAHITMQVGSLVYHYWTPRREGTRTFGNIQHNDAFVRVEVPAFAGDDITLTAEAEGMTATRKIKMPLPPMFAESGAAERQGFAEGPDRHT